MQAYLEIDEKIPRDQKLWRYLDLAKFISMLDKRALWLARADTFRDKHEGNFPEEMNRVIDKMYERLNKKYKSTIRSTEEFQDYLVKNTFISGWHKNFDENMVMWEIYGQDNNSVAVQTTIKRIDDFVDKAALSGHSLKLNEVVYKRADEVRGIIPYEDCFFIKRPHFAFEQEVRICLDTYSPEYPNKQTPLGYYLPAQIDLLIESVLVHPDSSDWFINVIKSIKKKYRLNADVRLGICGTS